MFLAISIITVIIPQAISYQLYIYNYIENDQYYTFGKIMNILCLLITSFSIYVILNRKYLFLIPLLLLVLSIAIDIQFKIDNLYSISWFVSFLVFILDKLRSKVLTR